MTVAQTSLLAYGELLKSNIKGKRKVVLDAIKAHEPICNQQLAEVLGWEINRITPRVRELRDLGRVQLHSKQVYKPTNKKVMFWSTR